MKQPFKYLVNDIDKKIKSLSKIVENHYGKGTAPKISISFDLNRVNVLGSCKYNDDGSSLLKLNPDLLNEMKEVYIDNVVTHEFAHACVRKYLGYYKNGRKIMPHGTEFKAFCRTFGISGGATTNIASNSKTLTENKKRLNRYTYVCNCREHEVSLIKHNRMKKGDHYGCSLCGGKLILKKKLSKAMTA